MDNNIPKCKDCDNDLWFDQDTTLQHDGLNIVYEKWDCQSCVNDDGLPISHFYPKGYYKGSLKQEP